MLKMQNLTLNSMPDFFNILIIKIKYNFTKSFMRFYIYLLSMLCLSAAVLAAGNDGAKAIDNQKNSIGEKRVALVIGNSAYPDAQLKNSVNDATDVAEKLRTLGFDVIEYHDLDYKKNSEILGKFKDKLVNASVAVVFYAGHGVQLGNVNYLPAVNSEFATKGSDYVTSRSLSLQMVMDTLKGANTRNLIFLDACRTDKYKDKFEGVDKQGSAPVGTMIMYAAAKDEEASDGNGNNGLFTSKLLAHMNDHESIYTSFGKIMKEVKKVSKDQQHPYVEGNLAGDFCFASCSDNKEVAPSEIDKLTKLFPKMYTNIPRPSFSCSPNKKNNEGDLNVTEHFLCTDNKLMEADGVMGIAYDRLRKSMGKMQKEERKILLEDQRGWVKSRDVACPASDLDVYDNARRKSTVDCLLQVTEKRAMALHNAFYKAL